MSTVNLIYCGTITPAHRKTTDLDAEACMVSMCRDPKEAMQRYVDFRGPTYQRMVRAEKIELERTP